MVNRAFHGFFQLLTGTRQGKSVNSTGKSALTLVKFPKLKVIVFSERRYSSAKLQNNGLEGAHHCIQWFFVCLILPCKQRRCVSWCVKSSLCQQPFKSFQKSGQINFKNRYFPVLDRFRALHESCVANQSCPFFYFHETRAI